MSGFKGLHLKCTSKWQTADGERPLRASCTWQHAHCACNATGLNVVLWRGRESDHAVDVAGASRRPALRHCRLAQLAAVHGLTMQALQLVWGICHDQC